MLWICLLTIIQNQFVNNHLILFTVRKWRGMRQMQIVTLQTRETCRQTRETLLWNALKTIPRLLEDLKFRKGIVLKSFHNNVYLVLSLPVCKITVCIYRTQFPPHGAISMLRKSALTIANRLPNDNRQVTNSSPTVDRPSVNSSIWENCQPTVVLCRPTVARLSTDCWSSVGLQTADRFLGQLFFNLSCS